MKNISRFWLLITILILLCVILFILHIPQCVVVLIVTIFFCLEAKFADKKPKGASPERTWHLKRGTSHVYRRRCIIRAILFGIFGLALFIAEIVQRII